MPKAKTLKKLKNGRYMYGGKFISDAQAKRIRAARRRKKNPGKKTTAASASTTSRSVKRNPVSAAASRSLKKNPVKKKTVKKNPTKRRKVKANPAKSARKVVKRNPLKRSTAVAKAKRKRNPAKKRRVVKSNPPKRKRRVAKKKSTAKRRRRPARKTVTRVARKTTLRLRRKPRAKKLSAYKVRRTTVRAKSGKKHYRYSIGLKKNPMDLLKAVAPVYAGSIIARVGSGVIKLQTDKLFANMTNATTRANLQAIAPTALIFGASLLVPKLMKAGKGNKLVSGIQVGATIELLDSVLRQFVTPKLVASENPTVKRIGDAMHGYDDMGIQGYGYGYGASVQQALAGGYGAYIDDPTGYSLPALHSGPIGADVHEAMAEYVPEGLGLDVEPALAGHEQAYLQSGGAGGSLRGTVFSS